MSDNVVYWLGAGFSAPLGIPVVRNFLSKAKDQFASDNSKHDDFSTIFELIEGLAKAKNYYKSNQFDIEEIFSILDMQSQLEGADSKVKFAKFIGEVVDHYTPTIQPYSNRLPGNWDEFIWGGGEYDQNRKTISLYGYFHACIHNLRIVQKTSHSESDSTRFEFQKRRDGAARYDIITVNYDAVLDSFTRFFAEYYGADHIESSSEEEAPDALMSPRIARLHGSVTVGTVVPPTWSKGLSESILSEWQRGFEMLRNANQLRIIGYSLPETDAYIRYLLKAASLKTFNLKKIDIICLDPDGSVQDRYASFIDFDGYRFANRSVEDYLRCNMDLIKKPLSDRLDCSTLEFAHSKFFS